MFARNQSNTTLPFWLSQDVTIRVGECFVGELVARRHEVAALGMAAGSDMSAELLATVADVMSAVTVLVTTSL